MWVSVCSEQAALTATVVAAHRIYAVVPCFINTARGLCPPFLLRCTFLANQEHPGFVPLTQF